VIETMTKTEPSNIELMLRAMAFATRMHEGQKRKYTGEPYILHCLEVARLVATAGGTPAMVVAALLHDVVEDTDTSIEDIEATFGVEVASLVRWLTDVSRPEDGNRAARKALDKSHISAAPPEAKTIKLADIISNTGSIVEHGRGFARHYLKEKLFTLEALSEGDATLLASAKDIIAGGLAKLGVSLQS
jgi:(p)ppGpp synthase/HD superfamily hydrolase